jgi:hypothetical protein
MASKTQKTLSLLFGPSPGGPPKAISRIRMIFVDRGHGPPLNLMQRDAKMTRGRENAACSATENGKRVDSVGMLYLNNSPEDYVAVGSIAVISLKSSSSTRGHCPTRRRISRNDRRAT